MQPRLGPQIEMPDIVRHLILAAGWRPWGSANRLGMLVDHESETLLLGTMVDPQICLCVAAILPPDAFTHAPFRKIYEQLLDMSKDSLSKRELSLLLYCSQRFCDAASKLPANPAHHYASDLELAVGLRDHLMNLRDLRRRRRRTTRQGLGGIRI